MKKFILFIAILILSLTEFAVAHPLGNFSINQYSRLEIETSQVKLRSVLDMAEIPTFQQSPLIDTDKNGELSTAELNAYAEQITPDYIANLSLVAKGQPLEIRAKSKRIELQNGAGNLPTIRVEWDFVGSLPESVSANVGQLKFENKNFAERIGWNEIVVNRVDAVNIFDSTAFGSGVTDEIKAYPQENLNAPLAERNAAFSYTFAPFPANAKPLQNRDGHTTSPITRDRFADLIAVPEITPLIALFGLLLAFGLGAMHAMSPGHGKTVVGAYLVGSKGTPKHAVFLGLTVTITHTLSVFALGLIALFASNYILPETLMPFLNFVSGLLVFFIGVSLFKSRLFSALGWKSATPHEHHAHEHHEHHGHSHQHEHGHTHSHGDGLVHTHGGSTHSHLPPEKVTWRNLLALGISGGLLPCPSALVLMLSAISLGRIGYGLLLTLTFSFGLASTLTAIGLIFLYVGKFFDNPSLNKNPLVKALPVFSALVITSIGAVICYSSL